MAAIDCSARQRCGRGVRGIAPSSLGGEGSQTLAVVCRVLPFDLSAARFLAAYRVPEHAPYDDALIAAVAQAAGKIVVTRNARHFEPLGVPCLDPWSDR